MMQAFAYRHLVPAQDLKVAVTKRGATRAALKILSVQPVRIPAGGTAQVQVRTPAGKFLDSLQLELSDPPEGISIRDVSRAAQTTGIVLQADAAKVKAGLQGNLIVIAFTDRPQTRGNAKAPPNRRRILLGTLPAISFKIVGP
jgi:hypothetical protein